jgi:hypothetical protein
MGMGIGIVGMPNCYRKNQIISKIEIRTADLGQRPSNGSLCWEHELLLPAAPGRRVEGDGLKEADRWRPPVSPSSTDLPWLDVCVFTVGMSRTYIPYAPGLASPDLTCAFQCCGIKPRAIPTLLRKVPYMGNVWQCMCVLYCTVAICIPCYPNTLKISPHPVKGLTRPPTLTLSLFSTQIPRTKGTLRPRSPLHT